MRLTKDVIDAFEKIQKVKPTKALLPLFKTLVECVLPEERDDIRFHLSNNVLTTFTRADKTLHEGTLSELERRAQQTEHQELKYHFYVYLGDYALFITGIFPQFLKGKLLDQGYFTSFGQRGYEQAARCDMKGRNSYVLAELSKHFLHYRDALQEMQRRFIPVSSELMQEMFTIEQLRYESTKKKEHKESVKRRAALLLHLPH